LNQKKLEFSSPKISFFSVFRM